MRSDIKPLRLLGLSAVVVVVMSFVAAGTASASSPEFVNAAKTGVKVSLTGTSGTSKLTTVGQEVTCATSSSTGEVTTNSGNASNVHVTFSTCTGKKGATSCAAHSTGKTNEIVTNTLKGALGTVKTTEAASGQGLVLSPASGSSFVKIEGTCLSPTTTSVEGSVAGEVSPLNKQQTTGKLVLSAPSGVQAIKSITVAGTVQKPKLEAFTEEAAEESSDSIKFGEALTVT